MNFGDTAVTVLAALSILLIIALILGFVVRVFGGVFSAKIRQKIKAHPFLHLLWFLLCLAIISPFFSSCQPQADVDMIKHFHEHKAEFLSLLGMLKENPELESISDSGKISPEGVIDNKRVYQYRTVMDRADLRSISAFGGWSGGIKFRLEGEGYSLRFDKGYTYSAEEPQPIKDSLDHSYDDVPPYSSVYRKIEGNWYIFLENRSD